MVEPVPTEARQSLAVNIIKNGVLVPATLSTRDGIAPEPTTPPTETTSPPAPRWAPA